MQYFTQFFAQIMIDQDSYNFDYETIETMIDTFRGIDGIIDVSYDGHLVDVFLGDDISLVNYKFEEIQRKIHNVVRNLTITKSY